MSLFLRTALKRAAVAVCVLLTHIAAFLPRLSRWKRSADQVVPQLGLGAIVATLCLSVFSSTASAQQTASYIYDELGRLKTVIAPNGDRANYDYDAAGNIIAVRRVGTGTLTISEFTPNLGASGTVVVIRGAGFSATAASNTVKFNGVNATVTAATTTQLTVSAPATGTTGPISVTVGANTATSVESFTYVTGSTVGAPTITSFSPTSGASPTQVTIIGTNFDLAPGATKVELNGRSMPIVSITATQIVATVPVETASGKIRVLTPKGIATSAAYFYVPVAAYPDADIVARQGATIGGAAVTLNVNVATAGKYGLILFDGNQNDYVSLHLSSYTHGIGGGTNFVTYNPDGTILGSGWIFPDSLSLFLPQLRQSGTHSVFVYPVGATVSFTGKLERDATLVANATATAGTVSSSSQSKRYIVNAVAGQTLGVGLNNLSHVPTTGSAPLAMRLYKPDGTQIGTDAVCYIQSQYNGCGLDLLGAPVDGAYSVVVTPPSTATSTSFSILLSTPVGGAITPNSATASTATTSRVGQMVRYTFTATAGQNLGIGISDLAMTTTYTGVATLYVYQPNGVLLSQSTCYPGTTGNCTAYIDNSLAGTYTVVISLNGATGSLKTQVNADAGGTLGVNTPLNISLKSGQRARYTFTASVGQTLGVGLTNLAYTPTSTNVSTIGLYKPDGTLLVSQNCYPTNNGCSVDLMNAPASGTYSVVITPPAVGVTTTAFTIQLSSPVAGSLTSGNITGTSVATTRPGQNVAYTYTAAVGQNFGIGLSDLAINAPSNATYAVMTVYQPSGAQQSTATCYVSLGGCTQYVNNAMTGAYSIVVTFPQAATGSAKLWTNIDAVGVLAANTAVNISLKSGQNARYTFAGTAGQPIGIEISQLATVPAGKSMNVLVYRPTDTISAYYGSLEGYWNIATVSGAGGAMTLPALPSTGTYTVIVNANNLFGNSASFALKLDAGTALVADAAPMNVTANAGQSLRYTFNASAGQTLGIGLANLAYTPASTAETIMALYKPDGTALTYGGECMPANSGCNVDLMNAPVAGTYSVVITPPANVTTTNFTIQLSSPVNGVLTLGAATGTTIATNRPGQNVAYTLSVTAGQNFGVGLSDLAINAPSTSTRAYMTLYGPNGLQSASVSCDVAQGGCARYVNNAAAGTYTFVVTHYNAATGSFKLWANNDVLGVLTANSAANVSLKSGQSARYTFAGTAGQVVSIELSQLTTVPAGKAMKVIVYRPTDTLSVSSYGYYQAYWQIGTVSGTSGTLTLPALPATGTYAVVVNTNTISGNSAAFALKAITP